MCHCKRGDRAALQPIWGLPGCMARPRGGWITSQYLSDHFTNQIWGIQPSYAFVAEPQTNGVAERFNRTLKEQIMVASTATSRSCGTPSATSSNSRIEKNGYLSPAQARQAWHAAISIRPAA